ncbi:unnamed protein product [Urochloa humidicola]
MQLRPPFFHQLWLPRGGGAGEEREQRRGEKGADPTDEDPRASQHAVGARPLLLHAPGLPRRARVATHEQSERAEQPPCDGAPAFPPRLSTAAASLRSIWGRWKENCEEEKKGE